MLHCGATPPGFSAMNVRFRISDGVDGTEHFRLERVMGVFPLSAKPFWPAPMVLCWNASTTS